MENTIVVPCNIGDKVYRLTQDFAGLCPELQVEAIHIAANYTKTGKKQYSHVLAAATAYPWTIRSRIRFDEFGIRAFLSREEAEAHIIPRKSYPNKN